MMTARIAVGSVSTLAMGALLLGSASFFLNRPGTASHATPWGDISSLSLAHAAAAQTDDQAQLLKLAALKSSADAAPAPVEPAPTASTFVAPAIDTSAAMSASPASNAAAATPPLVQSADPTPASPPVQMAAVEDPAPADAAAPVDDTSPAKPNLINLNTASTDALDRMGAGHVGRAIVSHRPYRNVKDLVNRRVLRTSDYQKIESRLRVD